MGRTGYEGGVGPGSHPARTAATLPAAPPPTTAAPATAAAPTATTAARCPHRPVAARCPCGARGSRPDGQPADQAGGDGRTKDGHWRTRSQVCAARRISSARCLRLCPRRHRFVSRASDSFRTLSPGMSLVTAGMCCMSCMFSTAAEDDPGAWDASDVDMFTQFSEAEGEGEGGEGWGDGSGWPDPDEARGRQMSQPLFSHTPPPHTHPAPAAASREMPQWWRRQRCLIYCSLLYSGVCHPLSAGTGGSAVGTNDGGEV